MSGKPNDKMFKTMVKKHGSEEQAREWFRSIGTIGGQNGHDGGFKHPSRREFASECGANGGSKSKRGFKYQGEEYDPDLNLFRRRMYTNNETGEIWLSIVTSSGEQLSFTKYVDYAEDYGGK